MSGISAARHVLLRRWRAAQTGSWRPNRVNLVAVGAVSVLMLLAGVWSPPAPATGAR